MDAGLPVHFPTGGLVRCYARPAIPATIRYRLWYCYGHVTATVTNSSHHILLARIAGLGAKAPPCRPYHLHIMRPWQSRVTDRKAILGLYCPPMPCGHCAVQSLRSAGLVRVGVFCTSVLPAHAEALRSPTADYRACKCHIVQFSS